MRGLAIALLTLLFVGIPDPAAADLFRFRDEYGRLHIVDRLTKVPPQYREQVSRTRTVPSHELKPPPKAAPAAIANDTEAAPAIAPDVDVYTTTWCGPCKRLKKWLDSEGIAYDEHDIEKSLRAKRTYKKLGGSGVPLTQVGEDLITGYAPSKIRKSLNEQAVARK